MLSETPVHPLLHRLALHPASTAQCSIFFPENRLKSRRNAAIALEAEMSIFSQEKLDQWKAEEAPAADRLTIMIVDDEPSNLAVMASILGPYYNLVQASDGQEALTLIQGFADPESLACIISDHRMPDLTGVELFELVQPILPQTIRIIVTGFIDVDVIVDSINKAEIYKFIIKPFDAHDFLLTVRRAVESVLLQRKLTAYYAELENKVRERTEELQKSANEILALYNNASCGYHSLDNNGIFVQINDTELKWLGRKREELIGKLSFQEILTPNSLAAFFEKFPDVKEYGWAAVDLQDAELEIVRVDGKAVPILLNATKAYDSDSRSLVNRFTVFDISERKAAQDLILHMANHDALTGLPNRSLLQDRVTRDILLARRNRTMVAVIFIDLDDFKKVNDTLGHHIGDQLLLQTAHRLQACVRESDTVARLGGDEFVISLSNLANGNAASVVAAKIVATLVHPFDVTGNVLQLSGSVGISVYPEDGAEAALLMKNADAAMYQAKAQGRNCFAFFASAPNGVN